MLCAGLREVGVWARSGGLWIDFRRMCAFVQDVENSHDGCKKIDARGLVSVRGDPASSVRLGSSLEPIECEESSRMGVLQERGEGEYRYQRSGRGCVRAKRLVDRGHR